VYKFSRGRVSAGQPECLAGVYCSNFAKFGIFSLVVPEKNDKFFYADADVGWHEPLKI